MADAGSPAEPVPETKEQEVSKEAEEEDPREALKREWREAVRKTRPKDAAGTCQQPLSSMQAVLQALQCSTA